MKLKTRVVVVATLLTLSYALYNLSSHHRSWSQKEFDKQEEVSESITLEVPNEKQIKESGQWPTKTQQKKYLLSELERLAIDFRSVASNFEDWPWHVAASWVSERQIYPKQHPELTAILFAMSSAKIIGAEVLPKGTQLKLLLILEGNQKVVFKQKRYQRDHIITGKPYDGFDRHNGEVAAFQLDRILDFRRAPLTVGRIINLRDEILPVATERLKKTFLTQDNNLCYYGVCYYCREEEKACADGDIMEGVVTLWLPEEYSSFTKLRHPYQRTYVDGRSAKWEVDESYCEKTVKHTPPYDRGTRLLDVADAAVFDYLIGNADRHHYEIFKNKGSDVMLLLMDNAKSFGNPYVHEPSILAPLRQCCILRNATWIKLHYLQNGVLTELLESALATDPIAPVLHPSHLNAMNERLPHLISVIEHCIVTHGRDKVLVNDWTGLKHAP